MFELIQKYERVLTREKLNELVRADWLPGATAVQVQRIQAMIAVFGVVPREVFTGEVSPKHTRRDMRISAETLQVLSHLELNPKMPKAPPEEPKVESEASAPAALVTEADKLPGTTNRKIRRESKKVAAIAAAVQASTEVSVAVANPVIG